MNHRHTNRMLHLYPSWPWLCLLVCCVGLGIVGAWQAQLMPHSISPATLPAAAQPARDAIEYTADGRPYRWLGAGYPIPLSHVSGETVLHLRIWTAPPVTDVALHTPHGSIDVPIHLVQPGRTIALLVLDTPWWRVDSLLVDAGPARDPQSVVAFAGVTMQHSADARVFLAGWWILMMAVCGWCVRGTTTAALLVAVSTLAVWLWPLCVEWIPAVSVWTTIAVVIALRPSLRRFTPWMWCVALVLTATFGIARMARRPSDFAELHWLLNYDAGFVKRGLIGSLLPATWQSESGIWWLAALVLLLALGGHAMSVGWVLTRSNHRRLLLLAALAIACSPAALMQGYLIGYFDALIVFGVLVGMWQLRPGRVTPIWVGILWAVLVLVHESTLLFVSAWALVVCAVGVLSSPQTDTRARLHHIWQAVWVVLFPLLTMATVIVMQRLQPVDVLHAGILQRAAAAPFATRDSTYDVARQVADWTVMPFAAHYAKYHGLFWQRLTSAENWLSLPTLLLLWLCARHIWDSRPGRWFVPCTVVSATLVPVFLDVIAVDTGRIASYTIVIGWYALIILLRLLPGTPPTIVKPWIWWLTALVAVFNSFTQPFWLVPYDLHATLPVHVWVLLLPLGIPFAWHIGGAVARDHAGVSPRCNGTEHTKNLF